MWHIFIAYMHCFTYFWLLSSGFWCTCIPNCFCPVFCVSDFSWPVSDCWCTVSHLQLRLAFGQLLIMTQLEHLDYQLEPTSSQMQPFSYLVPMHRCQARNEKNTKTMTQKKTHALENNNKWNLLIPMYWYQAKYNDKVKEEFFVQIWIKHLSVCFGSGGFDHAVTKLEVHWI